MAPFDATRIPVRMKYCFAALLGMCFSLIVWKIMAMDFRYAVALSGGLVVLSVAMVAIYRVEDFLVYAMVFNIPFAIFSKWLFAQEVVVVAKGISIGLAELLILLAYLVWFSQIVIARSEPPPRLQTIDCLIALLLITQVVSSMGAPNKVLSLFDITYTVKFSLIYFFLSRKIKCRHLRWIIILLLFAIAFESAFAFFERFTGIVSIGATKGNVSSADFGLQYTVPGIENEIRAAGTTSDAHTLGLYFAMLLPVPLVFTLMRFVRPSLKIALAGILTAGILGLVFTMSRSGWLSFAVAATVVLGIIVFSWKQRAALVAVIIIALLVSVLYPRLYHYAYLRLFEAPSGIMDARYDMNRSALDIWRQHFLLGYGPGNYTEALKDPRVREQHVKARVEYLPVHNMLLYLAAELGLFGVISFFGIVFFALRRCWVVTRAADPLLSGFALAIFGALCGYLTDGLFNPMFREIVPFTQFWVYIALSVALWRLLQESDTHLRESPQ